MYSKHHGHVFIHSSGLNINKRQKDLKDQILVHYTQTEQICFQQCTANIFQSSLRFHMLHYWSNWETYLHLQRIYACKLN